MSKLEDVGNATDIMVDSPYRQPKVVRKNVVMVIKSPCGTITLFGDDELWCNECIVANPSLSLEQCAGIKAFMEQTKHYGKVRPYRS